MSSAEFSTRMSPSRGCFGASRLAFLLLLVLPVSAQVQLTEFMANNTRTLKDDYGQYEDWIEIYNSSRTNVNLLDWSLTDKADNLTKWRFPSTNLPPRNYLLVFASNRDRRTPGAPLHTNFKLDPMGEYLALVRPDHTIATEFLPSFPPQMADASYNVSFGRYVNSEGKERFVLQSHTTPGEMNAPPRVGPVVISEIMYQHPARLLWK